MPALKINNFSGLRPRIPESLLPEGSATVAQNCDFAYGELRNTNGGYQINVNPLANSPAAIYTDDGTTFYTWTTDVDAVRSPLANDTTNRLFFTDSTYMKMANRLSATASGGPPGTTEYVGVPRPQSTPTLLVRLPDVTDTALYTLAFKFHYEYSGIKYQEQTITPTALGSGKYQFTPPDMSEMVSYSTRQDFPETGSSGTVYKAIDTGTLYVWNGNAYVTTSTDGTPTSAFVVLRITCTLNSDSSQVFDIYTENSACESTGGIWSLTIANDSGANTYTATLNTGIKEADKETRAYVYTFVNTYNEEGPPSSPATVVTSPIVDVRVTVNKDSISNYAPIKEIRIYRTPTGSTIANYFYVGAVSVLSANAGPQTFTDNVKAEMLNEELSSLFYYPPPSGLFNLMSLPNGILAALKGNEVWFSEAYKPWAWNPNNVKTLTATAVGGIVHGSGAVITTVKQPVLVSGVSPDSMTAQRINVDQAGVSKWSIAVVDGVCLYASHDGLVMINGATATLAPGQKFHTRDTWRARCGTGLPGMRFSVWDGRLVIFHASNTFPAFMIRFDEADGTLTDLPDLTAKCAFISQLSDQFYYANGSNLYQFNGGSAQTAVWQSRELVIPVPINYGMGQALTEGSWSLELWAYVKNASTGVFEYQLKHTKALTDGLATFRLPGGYETDRYRFKISGNGRFREFRMARTGRDLASV